MNKPTIRRLSDVKSAEKINRSKTRGQLGRVKISDDLKVCRQPVWISCFFDGTGNNYLADAPDQKTGKPEKYSNIAKLCKFAHEARNVEMRTYAIYAPGVGTAFPEIGDSGDGMDKALGMANAAKGQDRIDWMIAELKMRVENHMPNVNQINVAVFGFSRGAALARAFVRQLAAMCGREDADQLVWKNSGGFVHPKLVFYFVGIFDTVASTGYGGSRLEKHLKTVLPLSLRGAAEAMDGGGHAAWANDLRIPSHVHLCEHYVAAHEVREKFPSDSIRIDQATDPNCRETIYPGAHSDVGGGYDNLGQESRSNELSRIPLCNMYHSAYAAGVPFNPPEVILKDYKRHFEISSELENSFNTYMKYIASDSRLERQVISHMNAYYNWRWGRTERQRIARAERDIMISKGEHVTSEIPDSYMKITDTEWEKDVEKIVEKRTSRSRSMAEPVHDAIFEAWNGTFRKSLSVSERILFDTFFDRYVHDSVAGFKNQMTDASIGVVEASRWTRNRQYFMGKRGSKFLYWRYEGDKPADSGVKEAMLIPKDGPSDASSANA